MFVLRASRNQFRSCGLGISLCSHRPMLTLHACGSTVSFGTYRIRLYQPCLDLDLLCHFHPAHNSFGSSSMGDSVSLR